MASLTGAWYSAGERTFVVDPGLDESVLGCQVLSGTG
jgi:hypothetical protein